MIHEPLTIQISTEFITRPTMIDLCKKCNCEIIGSTEKFYTINCNGNVWNFFLLGHETANMLSGVKINCQLFYEKNH